MLGYNVGSGKLVPPRTAQKLDYQEISMWLMLLSFGEVRPLARRAMDAGPAESKCVTAFFKDMRFIQPEQSSVAVATPASVISALCSLGAPCDCSVVILIVWVAKTSDLRRRLAMLPRVTVYKRDLNSCLRTLDWRLLASQPYSLAPAPLLCSSGLKAFSVL